MKVSTDIIHPFLKDLMFLVQGIEDTIRMGDDGMKESCIMQVGQILKHIKGFTIDKLTPITPIPKAKLGYLIRAAKTDFSAGSNTAIENEAYYKTKLYCFIKANLCKINDLDLVPVSKLYNHIEAYVVIGSSYQALFYSNEWYGNSDAVLRDVVKEVEDYRKAHPQTTLF